MKTCMDIPGRIFDTKKLLMNLRCDCGFVYMFLSIKGSLSFRDIWHVDSVLKEMLCYMALALKY